MFDRLKKEIRNLSVINILLLTLAGVINAFGVIMFLSPVKLYDSGSSGTAMLISKQTPEWCSLSLTLLVLNIPIFLFGLRKQGSTFTIYSIYTVIVYAVTAWLITKDNDIFRCEPFSD